ncbi:hypothetical protein EYF80_049602 [Liparis tanakae]|uniref:Uncharacterized protein n=1 Tax=Liparis tanakae TaxID=230148 RepID=A0A4Z2FGD1_9TELE|nr:hypothetical protein EYF80_049602 [Liparis tanakae]
MKYLVGYKERGIFANARRGKTESLIDDVEERRGTRRLLEILPAEDVFPDGVKHVRRRRETQTYEKDEQRVDVPGERGNAADGYVSRSNYGIKTPNSQHKTSHK